jgi:uncharacterized protein YyaL (SSP411 family)
MREESFENAETAALLNALFVSIKVDREERPDVDALYMEAVQALNDGQGGWPMTVFLTPDGAPFAAGTYFPPVRRHGMPAFPEVLQSVATAYRTRRDEIERQAQAFRDYFRERGEAKIEVTGSIVPTASEVDAAVLTQAAEAHLAHFDPVQGGLMRAPKFPHPMSLAFLLRVLGREGLAPGKAPAAGSLGARLLPQVRLTLDKMAAGGIYDQVGGGFHRYATDAIWLVPHFEKMLYDNALLAPVYLAAWQFTGEPRYRQICEEVLDYVRREMTDPAGGFYSTQDADSEGEEGKFYVWSPDELRAALGDEDAAIAVRVWGVTERGNFEGHSILHIAEAPERVAAALGISAEQARAALERARTRLYEVRSRRIWPGRDDKVLAAWNGLMQRAFAEAGRILDRADYREAARRNAAFLRSHLVADGRLQRSWRQGRTRTAGYLEDYAAVVNALLSTYEATGETAHFTWARGLADEVLVRFWDAERETFYDTAHDAEQLIGRPRELSDGATPSGMSLATEALLRLWAFTGEESYREVAAHVLLPLVPAMQKQPLGFGHLLCALDDFVGPLYEVALVGPAADAATAALLATINGRYLPRLALARAEPGDAEARATVPLLEGRVLVGDRPAAYVCQGFVCQQPATDPEALARELT